MMIRVVLFRNKYDILSLYRPNELKNAIVALGMEQSIEDIVNMIQDLD